MCQCYALVTLKNLFCHVWGRSSILHNGATNTNTNNLYAQTLDGNAECVVEKTHPLM